MESSFSIGRGNMIEQQSFDYQMEINQLKEQFDFDFVALALVQAAEYCHEFKWEYVSGNRSNRYKRIVLQTGNGVAGHVFKTGKPMLVTDTVAVLGAENLYNLPIVVAEGLTSFGAIPLYKYNRVKGVLLVAYRDNRKMTSMLFTKFQEVIGPNFGPFYSKEMVKD